MRDQDVRRPAVVARQEKPTLLGGTKTCSHCCLIQGVSKGIVPTYPFTSRATAQCVIPKSVTMPEAGWARTCCVKDWKAQAILHNKYELCCPQVESKSLQGGSVEPITCEIKFNCMIFSIYTNIQTK